MCVVPPPTDLFHEFNFDCCSATFESNGVTLFGDSYDSHHPYPLAVQHRGAFLNNRTYYKIKGLDFSSNFGFNAWINSHDTGYATIFSVNADGIWDDDTVVSFSWRVANSKVSDTKRKNMVELRDWSNHTTKFALLAYEKSYEPKKWANLGLSVAYDWDTGVSTVCFYGHEHGQIYLRTVLTLHERFSHSDRSVDILGHRISSKGEASNQFFGYIYYWAFYNYAVEDFSRSLGHCKECAACGPAGDCLELCWYNEYLCNGTCARCRGDSMTCKEDGVTPYCEYP